MLYISSFLILSLLVTPFIFHKHAISKTLSRCFWVSFSVQVSELYSNALNTSVSYILTFVVLLISFEFHTFPSICHIPLANPTLLSTSFSESPLVLNFSPKYTKLSVSSSCCPSTSGQNFLL